MNLWLVRHAKPLIAKGLCYGQLDIAAEQSATQQAAKTIAPLLPATSSRCSRPPCNGHAAEVRPDRRAVTGHNPQGRGEGGEGQ